MKQESGKSAVAIIFPGQGSQSVGMLAALAAQYPAVEATFAEASSALGYDLWGMVQNGPDTELNRTDITQPAMLTAGVAVWRVWQLRDGLLPAVVAGHSLGEYSALVCAGAMSFQDAVKLVRDRGRFMQEAVPAGEGAMAALLGLDNLAVASVCADAAQGDVVAAVNFNAPGQVVIAGNASAVTRAMELAKKAGAKRAIPLPVSVPSHCALMKPAAERLAALLRNVPIQKPLIPVINNVDVAICEHPDTIRDALTRQLYLPVRWVEIVEHISGTGIQAIVESGPGKVLAGLNKRIRKGMAVYPVDDPDTLDQALQGILQSQEGADDAE